MYITYVSYITRSLLKLYVLNKYHHQNISMSSYLSRGLINKSGNYFCRVPDNESKVDLLGWNQSPLLVSSISLIQNNALQLTPTDISL